MYVHTFNPTVCLLPPVEDNDIDGGNSPPFEAPLTMRSAPRFQTPGRRTFCMEWLRKWFNPYARVHGMASRLVMFRQSASKRLLSRGRPSVDIELVLCMLHVHILATQLYRTTFDSLNFMTPIPLVDKGLSQALLPK